MKTGIKFKQILLVAIFGLFSYAIKAQSEIPGDTTRMIRIIDSLLEEGLITRNDQMEVMKSLTRFVDSTRRYVLSQSPNTNFSTDNTNTFAGYEAGEGATGTQLRHSYQGYQAGKGLSTGSGADILIDGAGSMVNDSTPGVWDVPGGRDLPEGVGLNLDYYAGDILIRGNRINANASNSILDGHHIGANDVLSDAGTHDKALIDASIVRGNEAAIPGNSNGDVKIYNSIVDGHRAAEMANLIKNSLLYGHDQFAETNGAIAVDVISIGNRWETNEADSTGNAIQIGHNIGKGGTTDGDNITIGHGLTPGDSATITFPAGYEIKGATIDTSQILNFTDSPKKLDQVLRRDQTSEGNSAGVNGFNIYDTATAGYSEITTLGALYLSAVGGYEQNISGNPYLDFNLRGTGATGLASWSGSANTSTASFGWSARNAALQSSAFTLNPTAGLFYSQFPTAPTGASLISRDSIAAMIQDSSIAGGWGSGGTPSVLDQVLRQDATSEGNSAGVNGFNIYDTASAGYTEINTLGALYLNAVGGYEQNITGNGYIDMNLRGTGSGLASWSGSASANDAYFDWSARLNDGAIKQSGVRITGDRGLIYTTFPGTINGAQLVSRDTITAMINRLGSGGATWYTDLNGAPFDSTDASTFTTTKALAGTSLNLSGALSLVGGQKLRLNGASGDDWYSTGSGQIRGDIAGALKFRMDAQLLEYRGNQFAMLNRSISADTDSTQLQSGALRVDADSSIHAYNVKFQGAGFTATPDHFGKEWIMTSAGTITFNTDSDAGLKPGDKISIIRMNGSTVTVAASGVTIEFSDGTTSSSFSVLESGTMYFVSAGSFLYIGN